MTQRFVPGLLWLALAACMVSVDPNEGVFSCDTDADCGNGYLCAPSSDGNRGVCVACGGDETCDGLDNDCNGEVDDQFIERDTPCVVSGVLGACAASKHACVDGRLVCPQTIFPAPERCDESDVDCDGLKACADPECVSRACALTLDDAGVEGGNCGFAELLDAGVDAGELDGGVDAGDAGAPDAGLDDAGVRIRACVPLETTCDDGVDNDLDGLTDCADLDCDAKSCGPDTVCTQRFCPDAG